MGTPLSQVQFPGMARGFSTRVNFLQSVFSAFPNHGPSHVTWNCFHTPPNICIMIMAVTWNSIHIVYIIIVALKLYFWPPKRDWYIIWSMRCVEVNLLWRNILTVIQKYFGSVEILCICVCVCCEIFQQCCRNVADFKWFVCKWELDQSLFSALI